MNGSVLFGSGARLFPELLLETRTKGKINNEMRPELNPVTRAASVDLWKRERPNARLRSITGTYNCIGLIVASRRTWVDPGDLLRVLKEDGYRKLPGEAEAEFGDIVVHRDHAGEVCHAGIVIRKNLYDPANPGEA